VHRYVLLVYEESSATPLARVESEAPFLAFQTGDVLELAGLGVRVISEVRHRLEHRPTPGGVFASLRHELHLFTRPMPPYGCLGPTEKS